jgi:NAD(P)H-flavin reductase
MFFRGKQMYIANNAKSLLYELISNILVNDVYFILNFNWKGAAPKAGQFFMVKPERSSFFLHRPISMFEYNSSQNTVKFLIEKRGKGTEELAQIQAGEKVNLIGPLGNSWSDFLPENGKAALIGGSTGVAPLAALVAEKPDYFFHFYAGFKKGFHEKNEENAILGHAINSKKLVVTAEDNRNALGGRIVDYIFEPEIYDVIFVCGSVPMLKAVKKKCELKKIRCVLSLESRMACGTGVCLGCTIQTIKGNRRCCTDGPIFPAGEVLLND